MLRFDRVTTPRLVLRRWQPGDLDSFAALNSDPEVMRHFPSTYDRAATAAMITAWEVKFDEGQYFYEFYVEEVGDQLWEIKLWADDGEVFVVEGKDEVD